MATTTVMKSLTFQENANAIAVYCIAEVLSTNPVEADVIDFQDDGVMVYVDTGSSVSAVFIPWTNIKEIRQTVSV